MVLYIFGVRDTHWLRLGYTSECPWSCARDGFWQARHPGACCGKLGWSDLELLALAPGTLEDKAAVKKAVGGFRYDFHVKEGLPLLCQAILDVNGGQACLPLPPRPAPPAPDRGRGKLAWCCGGQGDREWCACGKQVISRTLKRHRESEACKRARARLTPNAAEMGRP